MVLLVGAIALAATTLASAATDKHGSHVTKTKKAAKKKAKKKKKAATTTAATPSAATCTSTPAALNAAGKAFMA